MNGVGSWYHNAPMESFFGFLKGEWVHCRVFRTCCEASANLFFYIEAFYNRRRRHSALGYLMSMSWFGLLFRSSSQPRNGQRTQHCRGKGAAFCDWARKPSQTWLLRAGNPKKWKFVPN
jgi:hypothetical protein